MANFLSQVDSSRSSTGVGFQLQVRVKISNTDFKTDCLSQLERDLE